MQHLRFSYKGHTGIKSPDGLWIILNPMYSIIDKTKSLKEAIEDVKLSSYIINDLETLRRYRKSNDS